MNVEQMINQIARLSLDERDPDSDTQADILSYLNNVYGRILSELSDIPSQVGRYTTTTELTTDANGQVTLPNADISVKRVWNTSTKGELTATDVTTLEDTDPLLDTTGTPSKYFLTGTDKLQVYPIQENVTLKVRYMPQPNVLASDTIEANVRIPFFHHDVLVFGSMLYVGIDERDKGGLSLLSVFEAKFEDAKSDLFLYLNRQPSEPRRTVAY